MKTLTNEKISVSALSVQAAVLFLASLAPCCADPAPIIHYAPGENLEHIDVALIDRAEHEIDMAAYVLTDWPVMQALTRAADRGVAIRIYLDGTELAEREPAKVFNDLAETPGVEIRIKHKARDPMHLKTYQIDGRLLISLANVMAGLDPAIQTPTLGGLDARRKAGRDARVLNRHSPDGRRFKVYSETASGFWQA